MMSVWYYDRKAVTFEMASQYFTLAVWICVLKQQSFDEETSTIFSNKDSTDSHTSCCRS